MTQPNRHRLFDHKDRRLGVISVRATGFSPKIDRIAEVAIVMRTPYKTPNTYHRIVNPGIPILPEATRLHGLADADVVGQPRFLDIAPGLARFLGAADLVGFGIRCQAVPLLEAELQRAHVDLSWKKRSIVDLEEIYRHHQPRDLRTAVNHYLAVGPADDADALGVAETCSRMLDAQIDRHEDLPMSARGLSVYPHGRDPSGLFQPRINRPAVFAVGPYSGRTALEVAEIDPEYLRSLLGPGLHFQSCYPIEDALAKIIPPLGPSSIPDGSARAHPGEMPQLQSLPE